MNTLATRGLEEPFFQLCCCVSFLFWWEKVLGLHTPYVLRVPYSCGVVLVFLIWWEIVFGTSYLVCSTVMRLCQFLIVAGKLI